MNGKRLSNLAFLLTITLQTAPILAEPPGLAAVSVNAKIVYAKKMLKKILAENQHDNENMVYELVDDSVRITGPSQQFAEAAPAYIFIAVKEYRSLEYSVWGDLLVDEVHFKVTYNDAGQKLSEDGVAYLSLSAVENDHDDIGNGCGNALSVGCQKVCSFRNGSEAVAQADPFGLLSCFALHSDYIHLNPIRSLAHTLIPESIQKVE